MVLSPVRRDHHTAVHEPIMFAAVTPVGSQRRGMIDRRLECSTGYPATMKIKHAARMVLFTVALASMMTLGASQARTPRHRIGALCNDNTTSKATGRGACSHHGGVSCWQYSDG